MRSLIGLRVASGRAGLPFVVSFLVWAMSFVSVVAILIVASTVVASMVETMASPSFDIRIWWLSRVVMSRVELVIKLVRSSVCIVSSGVRVLIARSLDSACSSVSVFCR